MVREFKIVFPPISSDIFDIAMMDLEGVPLFYHSIKNLQDLYTDCRFFVECDNQKIIDYCNEHGIDCKCKEHIFSSYEIINAYQPFLYMHSQYLIVEQYRTLEVTDLQGYLFAKYIFDRLKQYSLSEQQKKKKSDSILTKSYCNEEICFIGDSLIEYWDLQEISGYKIFNAGISDLTTSECLELVIDKLQINAFSVFFIIIGTNDLKYKIKKDTIVANVIRLINAIRIVNTKAMIIYTLIPNVYRRWDRCNDEITELNAYLCEAIREDVLLLDVSFLNNKYGELDKCYTNDGVHFNTSAYNLLKNKIERILSKK